MPSANFVDNGNMQEKVHVHGVQNNYTGKDSSSSTEVIVSNLETELEDILETDPFYSVSQFQSLLFATILEDVIMSFSILSECNNHIRVLRVYDDMELLLNDKYRIAKPSTLPNDLDKIDPKQLDCNQYKLCKLVKDSAVDLEWSVFYWIKPRIFRQLRASYLDTAAKAMQWTYKGLVLSRSFRPLWNYCRDVTEQEQYGEYLKTESAKNKILARTLYRQLRQQRIQHTTAEYEIEALQDRLKKQIQDGEQMATIKERYVVKWQNARTEQHHQDFSDKHGRYTGSLEYYKRRTEQESVVHGEIEMLVSIIIQEKLKQIEHIMIKYETDIEAIDLKIQIQMSDVNKITAKSKELNEMLQSRAKEIKDWVKFKEDRAKAQKYRDDMNRCAVIVQAWWRGLLVRKQLGPFRPSKKPRPAKKQK